MGDINDYEKNYKHSFESMRISSIFCATAASRSPVNIFNVTVTAPVVGAKPDYNASVPATV